MALTLLTYLCQWESERSFESGRLGLGIAKERFEDLLIKPKIVTGFEFQSAVSRTSTFEFEDHPLSPT